MEINTKSELRIYSLDTNFDGHGKFEIVIKAFANYEAVSKIVCAMHKMQTVEIIFKDYITGEDI